MVSKAGASSLWGELTGWARRDMIVGARYAVVAFSADNLIIVSQTAHREPERRIKAALCVPSSHKQWVAGERFLFMEVKDG